MARILFCCCTLVLFAACDRFLQVEGLITAPAATIEEAEAAVPDRLAEPDTEKAPQQPITGAPTIPVRRELADTEIYRGTGNLVNVEAVARPSVEVTPGGDITLNFVNADIREVVRTVIGKVLGENYIIDPDVKGTATIQTSRPLSREAVLPTLEAVLRLIDAAIVKAEGIYNIVPAKDAVQRAQNLRLGTGAVRLPGVSIQIVPLSYIGAEEMRKILAPLASKESIVHVDRQRNLLVLAGHTTELSLLLETIEIFDIDWMKGMSFGLFSLKNVEATTLLDDLEPVFGDLGTGPLAGLIRLIPIERMNAILAISPQPDYLDEVQKWVNRLDRSKGGVDQRLFVYFVQNARAADLADVLTKVFVPEDRDQIPPKAELAPGLKPAELIRQQIRTEPGSGVPIRTTEPPQAKEAPPPPAPSAETRSGIAGESIKLSATSPIRIIADENRNALLISASPRDFRMVEAALKKLDVVPLQVMIEATILEVTLKDQLQYGLQWFFSNSFNNIRFSKLATGTVAPTFPGFSYFFNLTNKKVALDALISLTDIEVISSPQIMVLNNQTATIRVGDQVPIATQSVVTTADPDAPIVNTIQFQDTGVTLKVTPRVNASGVVILDILQEVSEAVNTTTSGIDSPTIQTRSINSTIAIHSGETVALGGLIKNTKTLTKSGLPGLSSIPILGALFSTTDDDIRRTELLILVIPRVVRNVDEARKVTKELRQRVRALIPLAEKVR